MWQSNGILLDSWSDGKYGFYSTDGSGQLFHQISGLYAEIVCINLTRGLPPRPRARALQHITPQTLIILFFLSISDTGYGDSDKICPYHFSALLTPLRRFFELIICDDFDRMIMGRLALKSWLGDFFTMKMKLTKVFLCSKLICPWFQFQFVCYGQITKSHSNPTALRLLKNVHYKHFFKQCFITSVFIGRYPTRCSAFDYTLFRSHHFIITFLSLQQLETSPWVTL